MKFRPLLLAGLAGGAALAPSRSAAQNLLYAQDGDHWRLVRDVRGTVPLVTDEKGRYEMLRADRFFLKKTNEYLPLFVSISHPRAHTSGLNVNGTVINNTFHYQAVFESGFPLHHVFIVLDMHAQAAGHGLFLFSVGDLKPHHPVPLDLAVPLSSELGGGKYFLHVFTDGQEVFQSEIPWETRERLLDRMVRRRIAGVNEANPQFFVGPPPIYPPALRKTKTRGEAVLAFRIGANGAVLDPTVESATAPAFGEAALEAVRQWRFLPRVRGGFPVETPARIPVRFSPS
jgi:TonB family protein